ncbi:hypothetical protein WN48_06383, partial [Eufriesea mexicana]
MRNIEIKAKISDPDLKISRIRQLTTNNSVVIKQHDVFFKASDGRLKLRKFEDGTGELIYYKRSVSFGPKLCNYEKLSLDEHACNNIVNILSSSNGCIGIVKK